jgi:hypothetical protein
VAVEFEDDFVGHELDRSRWLPHYLPAWSSLEATAARYTIADSVLELRIDEDQPLWLAGDHAPLRVSGIQSGNHSGPVGSTLAQQTYAPGAEVREQQAEFWGHLPFRQRLVMRARMTLSPRSMAAWWLVGRELAPEESGELCVFEVFGDAVVPGESAAVGSGTHTFRDPELPEDFLAPRIRIDVTQWHEYSVDWTSSGAVFRVDGDVIRSVPVTPGYPLQHMIAVFDFPDRGLPFDPARLEVDWLRAGD